MLGLTTHYLEEADHLARRLAIIDRGRVVVAGALDHRDGIHDVVVEGQSLHARAVSGATAVPAVLAALEAEGVKVASVTVARPSLDDVYLRYAGRTFGAADRGGAR